LSPRPQQTPFEYSTRLVSLFPLHAEALDGIVQAYVQSRFSYTKESGQQQTEKLRGYWREVYPAFLKRLFRIRY